MIVFIRSSLFDRDVRASKYVHFLDKKRVLFIEWDREDEREISESNYFTFKLRADYGKGWRSLCKFLSWNIFLFKTIHQNLHRIQVIQINDIDSYPGICIFRLFGKKVIFDSYDFFTDSKITNTKTLLYKLLYHFEMLCLRFSDLLILPAEYRKHHLNFEHKNLLICENVPMMENCERSCRPVISTKKLKIAYAGTLEKDNRGLEWIPEIARALQTKVEFYIAGSGALTDFFIKEAESLPNLHFMGKLSHKEALDLQKSCDLIYAIYLTRVKNNVMAAPNKFYESMYLGVPLITNNGLYLSKEIASKELGFVVDEDKNAVLNFLINVTESDIQKASNNSLVHWNNYYDDYLNKKYKEGYQTWLSHFIRF